MRKIQPIPYPGMGYIQQNIERYKEQFINEHILLFRGANLNENEQVGLQKIFNESLGCFPSKHTMLKAQADYTEDHHNITNKTDHIILGWHIEHPYFDNPMVLALWNMELFDSSNSGGDTLFVSGSDIYNMLSTEEKDFLNRCYHKETEYPFLQSMIKPLKDSNVDFFYKIVQSHWLTNEPVLRMHFADFISNQSDEFSELYSVDGKQPTIEERKKYNNIVQKIMRLLNTDGLHIMVQEWEQGDLLIVDIHLLIHAVTGGFTSDKRKFRGLWSYQKDLTKFAEIDVDRRLQSDLYMISEND
jgi:alpha-ketoglutarate-dependent taurine dioxygenase